MKEKNLLMIYSPILFNLTNPIETLMMIKILIFGKDNLRNQLVINFNLDSQIKETRSRDKILKKTSIMNQNKKFKTHSKIHSFQKRQVNQLIRLRMTVKVKFLKRIDLQY